MAETNGENRQSNKPVMIGGFEIISKIGQGAVGYVYKARQVSVGRTVAVKVLAPKFAKNKRYVERFLREARSLANLNHVNIVQGIDAGLSPEGHYYFAMEYVEGESAKKLLKRLGVVPELKAVEIAMQVAQALRHASKINLVHRDIKPENILITPDGVAKLADLGLAKSGVEDVSLTVVGQAMGTPLYISPEQAQGQTVDVRSDIYSLGATLYHLATGHAPFTGENPTVTMLKHINEQPLSPREVNPQLSVGLSHVIEKMMAKKPDDRYQTATDLLDDLSALAAGRLPGSANRTISQPQQAGPAAIRPQRTRGIKRAVVAATLVAAAVIVTQQTIFKKTPQPPQNPQNNVGDQQVFDPAHADPAQQLFVQAAKLEGEGKLPEAQTIFQKITADHPDSPFAPKAAEHLAAIAKQQSDARQASKDAAAFEALKKQVAGLQAEQRLTQAIDMLKEFQKTRRQPEIEAEAEGILQQLRGEVRQTAEKLRQQGKDFLNEQKFAEAQAAFNRLKELNFGAWADEGLAAVDKARQQFQQANISRTKELWMQFADTLLTAGPDEAKKLAEGTLADDANKNIAEEIQWNLDLLKELAHVNAAAYRGLQSLDGSEFALRGSRPLKIRKVAEQKFELNISGAWVPCTFESLSPDERLRLARHEWQKQGEEHPLARAAWQLCELQDVQAARTAAEKLPEADRRKLAARIDLLEPELQARALLEEIKTADAKKEWRRVLEIGRRLEDDFAQTPAVRQNAEHLAAYLAQARNRRVAEAVPKRFAGDVQMLKGGQWLFRWNFASAEQLADFEVAEKPQVFADKARPPQLSGGAMVLKGVDAIAPVVLKGDALRIEFKINLLEEKSRLGYGRLLLTRQPNRPLWEFAVCHTEGRFDFFRNFYTQNRWQQEFHGKITRGHWHSVRIDSTRASTRVTFDGRVVYNSLTIKQTGSDDPDPSAVPDLAEPLRIRFSGWDPDDTWAIDDVSIIGTPDPQWLESVAGE